MKLSMFPYFVNSNEFNVFVRPRFANDAPKSGIKDLMNEVPDIESLL